MSDLTPNLIINRYQSKELNLTTTINLLISLIEVNEDNQLRIEAIKSLAKLDFKKDYKIKIFKVIENSFISDDCYLVRKVSIENLVRLFPKKCIYPLKWAINNEKSVIVFKTIIDLLEKIDISKRKFLKDLIAEKFDVIFDEVDFFCDLIIHIADSSEKYNSNTSIDSIFNNIDNFFVKTNSMEEFKELSEYSESYAMVYAILNRRVIALYLSHWELEVIPKSLKKLSKLKWLDLRGNKLETIPDWFGELIDLSYLNLLHNNLKTLPKTIFKLSLRNFSQKYVNNGVDPHDAAVLGILEIMLGDRIEDIKLTRRDHGEMILYEHNDEGFIIRLIIHLEDTGRFLFIPECIGSLKHLENLDISTGSITKLPEFIGDLSNLKSLRLSFTSIEIIPESIGDLTMLEELILSKNKIKVVPDSLGKLTSLKSLFLGKNKIQKIPDSIGNLRELKFLDLSENEIRRIPKSLGNLKSLRGIYIFKNKISKFPKSIKKLKNLELFEIDQFQKIPEWLKSFTSSELLEERRELRFARKFNEKGVSSEDAVVLGYFRSLIGREFKDIIFKEEFMENIRRGSFSQINGGYNTNEMGHVTILYISLLGENMPIPEQIGRLKHLEELHFLFAWMKELPEWIGSLTHLKKLSITDGESIEVIPASIGNLKHLRELDLSGNCIREIPDTIGNLTFLKKLNLSYNKISFLPKSIIQLGEIEYFNLENNELASLPRSFSSLSLIKELNISKNKFSELPKSIKKLKNIENLEF